MLRDKVLLTVLLTALVGSTVALGCHADDNDPAGQARELSDPVRRAHAIGNLTRLYTKALADASGDRNNPAVKAMADTIVQPLVDTYLQHPEDNQSRQKILNLLKEMRDVRSWPALKEALKWRAEVSEEQAITAAQTIQFLPLDDAKKPEVAQSLADALASVADARPVDNRMRIEFIRALGNLNHPSATDALVAVAVRQSESQSFLINLLAFEQLAKLGAPSSIPALVKGLYMYDPKAPQRRANDVAALGLVRVGRASIEPVLAALAGNNQDANALMASYLEAMRAQNPVAASMTNVATLVAAEATYTLGEIGDRSVVDVLVRETETRPAANDEPSKAIAGARRLGGAIALARIYRNPEDTPRIRAAIQSVYRQADKPTRMQVLRAMQHLIDEGSQPFLLEVARTREDELPDLRIIALNAYAMLATKAEAAQARAVIAREPGPDADEPGFKTVFIDQNDKALSVAEECDVDVACYIRKLDDRDPKVARKAAYMLARLGRGNPQVLSALVAKIGHQDATVRGDVLYAVDYVAERGSPEAIAKIEELARTEEGRSIWTQTKTLALTTAARLRMRAGG
jgi:hypothetical protein